MSLAVAHPAIMETLFWISMFVLFYAYIGYPLVIRAVAGIVSKDIPGPGKMLPLPTVTLLISAYNEEKTIGEKIANSLSLDYPGELLRITVISDGSTDRTNETVLAFAGHGVQLRSFPGRTGKTACLNKVVPGIRSEIIVFSDANSLYDREAIRHLVTPFADNGIGFVTGYTRYVTGPESFSSLGLYAFLEKFTKQAESRAGSCVGADGAIFAIRSRLYRPLLETDINDFVIPLRIVRQGYRGVLADGAFCEERSAGSARGEFRRQIRITNRTLRALVRQAALFNPFVHGLFSFQLFSHKAAKFLAPFFAVSLAVSSVLLAPAGQFYRLFLGAEIAFVLLSALEPVLRRIAVISRVSSFCSTFIATNLAVLAGWFQFLKGETYTVWSPVKR